MPQRVPTGIGEKLFVSTAFSIARKPSVSLKYIGRILSAYLRGQGKQSTISTVFFRLTQQPHLQPSPQRRHLLSRHTTFRKPQMALEVKPQKKRLSVNNIKNTNKQAKKRKKETDWSQQIYVHVHIKKRAVSGVGEGGRRKRRKIWAIR